MFTDLAKPRGLSCEPGLLSDCHRVNASNTLPDEGQHCPHLKDFERVSPPAFHRHA